MNWTIRNIPLTILVLAMFFCRCALGENQQQPPLKSIAGSHNTAPAGQEPEQIKLALKLLQQQVQDDPSKEVAPVQLQRQEPVSKDVPVDFQEHRPVSLPPTAQKAIAAGLAWSMDLNLPAPGKDGRVMYTFGEGMPVVVCTPLRVCVVELESGERFAGSPHLGDSIRWDLSVEASGAGESSRPIVVVKPKDRDLDTVLFITTDRRSYYIRLLSTSELYTPIIAFNYPEEQQAEVARQIALQQQHTQLIDTTQVGQFRVPVNDIFFDYAIKGNATFRPIRVMDDGVKTYIQMSREATHRELPSLAIEGPGGRELVNFRVKGDFYVVDRLFNKALLLLGAGKHTQKVEIIRQSSVGSNVVADSSVAGAGGN
jgi:P-type conjugative transfer protein TrbG